MLKLILISWVFVLIFNSSSLAYLGPGFGGGILAATFGIIVAIFAVIFGIIWFPLKRLIKKKKIKKRKSTKEN